MGISSSATSRNIFNLECWKKQIRVNYQDVTNSTVLCPTATCPVVQHNARLELSSLAPFQPMSDSAVSAPAL